MLEGKTNIHAAVDKQKGICDLKQKAAMALRLVSCRLAE